MAGPNEAFAVPTLAMIKGIQYELSPLTFSDIGRLTERLKSQVLNRAKEVIKDPELSRTDKALIFDRAQVMADKVSLFGTAGEDEDGKAADKMLTGMLNDPGLMTYIVWLGLNKKHPEITYTALDAMFNLNDKGVIQDTCIEILSISGFAVVKTEDDGKGKNKRKKKKAKKKSKKK